MSRPDMQWRGKADSPAGEATLIAGEMRDVLEFNTCADALKIQRLMDKAYIDGARDGQDSQRRMIENAIHECRNKW